MPIRIDFRPKLIPVNGLNALRDWSFYFASFSGSPDLQVFRTSPRVKSRTRNSSDAPEYPPWLETFYNDLGAKLNLPNEIVTNLKNSVVVTADYSEPPVNYPGQATLNLDVCTQKASVGGDVFIQAQKFSVTPGDAIIYLSSDYSRRISKPTYDPTVMLCFSWPVDKLDWESGKIIPVSL